MYLFTAMQLSPCGCTQLFYSISPESSKLLQDSQYTHPAKTALASSDRMHKVACMRFHAINGSGLFCLYKLQIVCTPSHMFNSSSESCILKSNNTNTRFHCFHSFSYLGLHAELLPSWSQALPWYNCTGWLGVKHQLTWSQALLFHHTKYSWKPSSFHNTSTPTRTSSQCPQLFVCTCCLCVCVRVCTKCRYSPPPPNF